MDDEKHLLKYLSWLDDLDQDYIFNTVDDSLDVNMIKEVKMDHSNLDTQTNPENGIPFSSNSNFEYTGAKIIPDYNVSDTILTDTMVTQPVALPDTFQCNYNFLSNDNFYSNSLPTQPVPHKLEVNPDESHFSVDLNSTVPPGHDSYDPSSSQLSMNTSTECSNMNISAEQSQIPLSDSIEIKDDAYFTEEKDIPLNTDYHPPAENIKSAFPSDFTPIPDQSKMYNIDISQENIPAHSFFPSVTKNLPNYSPVVENTPKYSPVDTAQNVDTLVVGNPPNSFIPVVENTENQNNAVISSAMDTQDDYHEPMKIDPDPGVEVRDEFENKDRIKTEIIQEPSNEEPFQQVEQSIDEVSVEKKTEIEEPKTEAEIQPTVNGVENIKNENETRSVQMCIRNGCVNRAINHPEWEQEFCSNDCVIIHCRNVFTTWVTTNEIQS